MFRTAAIAFPVTLFVAWWAHVVNRAGNGPGLQWQRIPNNATFTAVISGVPYLVFAIIALAVLYVTRVRGQPGGTANVLGPALLRLAAVYAAALLLGVVFGEWFCVADERAFARETVAHRAGAVPDSATHTLPLYSRQRWWPGSAQLLVSTDP